MVIRDQAEDIKLFFGLLGTIRCGYHDWRPRSTSDDITRETIAEILGEKMVYDTQIEDAIKERFLQLKRPMPKSNNRQCYRPESAEVLNNPYGTAPGLFIKKENKILVMLPGPAREMHPMFLNSGSQIARGRIFPEIDCYLQLRTAGIGE